MRITAKAIGYNSLATISSQQTNNVRNIRCFMICALKLWDDSIFFNWVRKNDVWSMPFTFYPKLPTENTNFYFHPWTILKRIAQLSWLKYTSKYILITVSLTKFYLLFFKLQSLRSYTASKPFRELRLRHHIIQSNQLKVMPLEHICNRVEGVWNLASNQVG